MAKSRSEIQAKSDAKRGIISKTYKLHQDDVALIKEYAERLGIPQNQLIINAVRAYVKEHS
ncbi:hypothetical protein ACFBZI_11575 [Moraxella sp. ZJ142]|uniref:hypothetical protein n=1 Tax=Moraxella marmotae TaxID=3344520 RepID=UPI0035D440D0